MKSLWLDSVKDVTGRRIKTLEGDVQTDVLIIGGGLAGILCAYKLEKAGVRCIVVEARRIGEGVSGYTTAKITAQHALIYADLVIGQGRANAQKYYRINQEAVSMYRALAKKIPCDFEEKTAYIYSTGSREKLEREARAYQRLDIPMHFKDTLPLPFPVAGGLGMEHQAQFHPLKLLYGLANELTVYEDTFISKIEDMQAITENGKITAKHIILATHYPMINIPGLYFMKMTQQRSYVLALQSGPNLNGMYLDEQENGFSFRNYENFLLIGGGGHKTGKKGGYFEALRSLSQKAYPDLKESFAWATQDCMTLDSVPYIGIHRKTAPYLYVATGFNKWGMTGSMVAATILCDLITQGKSDAQNLFSPQRSMFHPKLFSNIWGAVQGLAQFGGKRCPHMGCALKWNKAEQTWDCPCHGSRFSSHGNLINNPAKKDLPNA